MTPLTALTDALRLFSAVLAAAILIWWSLSIGRLLAGAVVQRYFGALKHPGDQNRAVWWIMAAAVMTFQSAWLFYPPAHVDPRRVPISFMAQALLSLALMLAIYVHQTVEQANGTGTVRIRRIVYVHLGMTLLCAVTAFVLR